MIHVALLRGINVGGKHKVPMARLRSLCEALGLGDVETYINSGNVVFDAEDQDEAALAERLETAIAAEFGFTARALVRSGPDIVAIAEQIPTDWTNDASMKTDVVYLFDGVDPAGAAAMLKPRDEIDTYRLSRGALIWMVARGDAARSGLQNILGTPLYQQATVRNVNTARKLSALVQQRA